MAHDISIKEKAKELRRAGYSIKEVAKTLGISISTSSIWLRNMPISASGKAAINRRNQLNRYRMSLKWNKKRILKKQMHLSKALEILKSIDLQDRAITKLLCATLFWAEGNKNFSHVRFTNSDPTMIRTFLGLLNQAFTTDKTKFRACIHLHEYHDSSEIHSYWQQITNIPLSQFRKAYLKPNTGVRKRDNYKGCITIYYFDTLIARELEALYNALSSTY